MMVRLPINGLSNGEHPVAVTVQCSEVDGIFPEFIGDVVITGTLTKAGKRLVLTLRAKATAELACDYSLESFHETIEAEFTLSFLQDTSVYLRESNHQQRIEDDPYAVRPLRDDDTFVDITRDIAQELSVRLPIKRVAPQYRHMTFAEFARSQLNGNVQVAD